jgi:oxygen-dependent protoporphyrinogen oxidase
MKRILVIGGGIAGLAAAHRLAELNGEKALGLEVLLLEASARLGGTIATERVGDFIVEAGPDSFITEKPWALRLCDRLGLTSWFRPRLTRKFTSFIAVSRPLPETFCRADPQGSCKRRFFLAETAHGVQIFRG